MRVAKVLEQRRETWRQLEHLCDRAAGVFTSGLSADESTRLAALYRAACADLALADSYHLPPAMVQYLHSLVARAHNQLYRTSAFDYGSWGKVLFEDVPQAIFQDRCVQGMFLAFWGLFIACAIGAHQDKEFAQAISPEMIQMGESSFSGGVSRSTEENYAMAAFYIWNNTSIGLKCFSYGVLVIPGVLETIWTAAKFGALFGYMARPDVVSGGNFFHFVTAHGPFELTAIVLMAGGGLRLGVSWVMPGEYSRLSALKHGAIRAMPVVGAGIVLFFLAALIEGFVSATMWEPPTNAVWLSPYNVKAVVAAVSSGMLMLYFVVLGYPR